MKRCVIVGGAPIKNYQTIRESLQKEDYFIFCDQGMRHCEPLGVQPDLLVGDFDSWKGIDLDGAPIGTLNQELNYREVNRSDQPGRADETPQDARILVLPHDKYDTDSVYGVREGMARGFEEFLLIGVIGGRFDHSLGNLYILQMLHEAGKHGVILDDYSEMELIFDTGYVQDHFSCFSLLNITGIAKDITIENARYCYLPGREIPAGYQYAVSNEVLPGKTARITVGEGSVLLIRNRA